jgi:hypothetical protein
LHLQLLADFHNITCDAPLDQFENLTIMAETVDVPLDEIMRAICNTFPAELHRLESAGVAMWDEATRDLASFVTHAEQMVGELEHQLQYYEIPSALGCSEVIRTGVGPVGSPTLAPTAAPSNDPRRIRRQTIGTSSDWSNNETAPGYQPGDNHNSGPDARLPSDNGYGDCLGD